MSEQPTTPIPVPSSSTLANSPEEVGGAALAGLTPYRGKTIPPRLWPGWLRLGLALMVLGALVKPAAASLTQPTNTVEADFHRAIVNGDVEELEFLLKEVGELSSSDQAIAKRALTSMRALGDKTSCREMVQEYGIDWANKVHHAVNSSDGAVREALLKQFGSAETVFVRVHKVINELRGLPNGPIVRKVTVDGIAVVVRMIVAGSKIRISTLLKRE